MHTDGLYEFAFCLNSISHVVHCYMGSHAQYTSCNNWLHFSLYKTQLIVKTLFTYRCNFIAMLENHIHQCLLPFSPPFNSPCINFKRLEHLAIFIYKFVSLIILQLYSLYLLIKVDFSIITISYFVFL